MDAIANVKDDPIVALAESLIIIAQAVDALAVHMTKIEADAGKPRLSLEALAETLARRAPSCAPA